MKRKKALMTLAIALALVCAFTLGVSAAAGAQQITALLDPTITVNLDGEAQVMTDATGARVYPITYNGTTYLPIRALAGLLGLEVNWDQATRTVQLGKATGVDLLDTYKAYAVGAGEQIQSSAKKTKDISGISCSHWLYMYTYSGQAYGVQNDTSFNIGGKYDTLTFQYYSVQDTILRVLGDNGSVLAEIPVTGGQVAQTITVNLLKTSQLTFQTEKTDSNRSKAIDLYIFDAHLF